MTAIVLDPGGLLQKDPSDAMVVRFDWDAMNLATSVTITSSSWAVTSESATPESPLDLTVDAVSVVTGNRKTQARLSGGVLGQTYLLTNTIVTSETPAQTKERSIQVLIEER